MSHQMKKKILEKSVWISGEYDTLIINLRLVKKHTKED